MYKNLRVIVWITLFGIISLRAAEKPIKRRKAVISRQRKCGVDKTQELQRVVDRINDSNHSLFASEVVALVNAKANPNLLRFGCCPPSLLGQYVQHNNRTVVACLLDHKADPNGRTSIFGETPLFLAESSDMVELLLDRGANLYERSSFNNNSMLHNAALHGRSPHVLASLCQAGLDVNLLNENDEAPLERLFVSMLLFKDARQQLKMMKKFRVLYWYGSNPHRRNKKGENVLEILQKKDPLFAARLDNLAEKLSLKREDACKSLPVIIASFFEHEPDAVMIGNLISQFSGVPALSPGDIEAIG